MKPMENRFLRLSRFKFTTQNARQNTLTKCKEF
jgi:hypothetical protein